MSTEYIFEIETDIIVARPKDKQLKFWSWRCYCHGGWTEWLENKEMDEASCPSCGKVVKKEMDEAYWGKSHE